MAAAGNPYQNPDLIGKSITTSDASRPYRPEDAGWTEADLDGFFDGVQTGISVLGMIPLVGSAFDMMNAGIYAARGKTEEAALSLIGAIPGYGDFMSGANLLRKAVVLTVENVGRNLVGQYVAGKINPQREFSYGQAAAATLTGGLGGTAGVGLGRMAQASSSLAKRMGILGATNGAIAAAGSAARQYLDDGRVDWNQLGVEAAFGALGSALGHAAFDKTCFRTGTPMQWEHGYKKVEELRQGERLAARNEFDPEGPLEWKAIEEVFVRRGLILEVTVQGQVIGTTAEHPFYLHGKGWTPAGELAVGDLLASGDGRWLPVEKVYNTGTLETVYNFRIADHHTYFVGDKDWGFSVWAHNRPCPGKKVADTAHKSDAAQKFQKTANEVAVPWKNKPDPRMRDDVRFDGWSATTNELIDRKLNVTRHAKSKRQVMRQAEVAMQHGVSVRWEVPKAKVKAARSLIDDAGYSDVIRVQGI